MTKSEEWEQFSAYRPMIEDAKRRGREEREAEIIAILEDPSTRDEWIYRTRSTTPTFGNVVEVLVALIKENKKEKKNDA